MKKISILLLVLFLLPSSSFPLTLEELEQQIKSLPIEKIPVLKTERRDFEIERIKAVQIFVLPEKEKWNQMLDSFKKVGADTVIIRVFHNSGDRYHCFIKSNISEGVYFKTAHLPLVEDILGDFIKLAKPKGFKVFAWMTTRYASYGRQDLKRVKAYAFEKNSFYYSKGLNILDIKNQQFIISFFKDLATYPVDGILLQDDLFLRHNEGFFEDTDLEFQQLYGKKPIPGDLYVINANRVSYTELFLKWRDFKSKKMASFIKDLKTSIREINPQIKLAVNLTYESISNPDGALKWLTHNLEDLKDVADYFSLMAYHRQIMDELKLNLNEVREFLSRMTKKCYQLFKTDAKRVIFKLQIKDWKTNEPIEEKELLYIFEGCTNLNDLSIALVPYPPDLPGQAARRLFSEIAY